MNTVATRGNHSTKSFEKWNDIFEEAHSAGNSKKTRQVMKIMAKIAVLLEQRLYVYMNCYDPQIRMPICMEIVREIDESADPEHLWNWILSHIQDLELPLTYVAKEKIYGLNLLN
jgi:hypothetical protein